MTAVASTMSIIFTMVNTSTAPRIITTTTVITLTTYAITVTTIISSAALLLLSSCLLLLQLVTSTTIFNPNTGSGDILLPHSISD